MKKEKQSREDSRGFYESFQESRKAQLFWRSTLAVTTLWRSQVSTRRIVERLEAGAKGSEDHSSNPSLETLQSAADKAERRSFSGIKAISLAQAR